MKFIAFSDTHFHPHNVGSTMLEGGISSRLMDIGNAVREVYQYAKINDIEHVVFAGDLFHTKKNVDVPAFNLAWKIIKSEAGDIKTLMIPGNHDIASPDGSQNSLEAFHGDNATVYSKPQIKLLGNDGSNCLLCFVPFPAVNGKFNKGKFLDSIERIQLMISDYAETGEFVPKQKILVTHAHINELMIRHHGFEGDFEIDEISSYFDLMLLGHHHIFDEIRSPEAKLKAISLGSVLPLTFNDVGHLRGFTVIDTDEPNHYTFIKTTAPDFMIINNSENFDQLEAGDFKDAIVRIKAESEAEAKRMERQLVKSEARDWTIEILDTPSDEAVRLEVADSLKTNEILDAYMKSEWGKTGLDMERLLKSGLSFIEGGA